MAEEERIGWDSDEKSWLLLIAMSEESLSEALIRDLLPAAVVSVVVCVVVSVVVDFRACCF